MAESGCHWRTSAGATLKVAVQTVRPRSHHNPVAVGDGSGPYRSPVANGDGSSSYRSPVAVGGRRLVSVPKRSSLWGSFLLDVFQGMNEV